MEQAEKIIILGHTGFIGSALLKHFQKDKKKQVFGFSSKTLDLLNLQSLNKLNGLVDQNTILILASAITREKGDTLEVFNENVAMAANVAKFLESHPVGKCIYYSSIAVYGDPQTNLAMNENTGVRPDSYYALAKYAGEFVLQEASKRIGFRSLVLRASRVYGPGDTHATYGPMKFMQSIAGGGKVYVFGEGEELRDHLHIDDLVQLTDKLAAGYATGTFNLVTGKSQTFKELIENLQEISPRPFEVVKIPRKRPLIHQQFDIKKLQGAVPGFTFTPIKQGLQETFDAFVAVH